MSNKILFVGLGSAGQRHLRNMIKLTGGTAELAAYRSRQGGRVFSDDMRVLENETLAGKYGIREFSDYSMALDEKPDIVVIANPNNMHAPYALKAAERGCHLFIEKPLATDLASAGRLIEMIDHKKIICQVGFQQRYHPCIQLARKYLSEGRLGRIVSVDAQVGERISRMHSYGNYQEMPEGQEKLGGGVVLCQIHELDYIYWLFGEPDSVYSVGGKKGGFCIDVEDTATTLFRYGRGEDAFAVTVHQDFIQYPPVRKCKFIGTQGRIEIDLLSCRFVYQDYEEEKKEETFFHDFERNDMFLAELRDFISCVEEMKNPECSVRSAAASLRMGLAVKKSFIENREVSFSEIS